MAESMARDIATGILSIPLYMIAIVDATVLGNAIQTLLRWLHISKPARVGPNNREVAGERASRSYSYKIPPHRPLSRSTHKDKNNFVPSLMPVCESALESKVGDMELDDDIEDPLASARARGRDSPVAALGNLRHHSSVVVEE